MKRILFLIAVFAAPICCMAQQPSGYDALISAAENDLRQAKYEEALEKYTAALEISEIPAYQIYNAACVASKAGKTDRAYELLFRRLAVDKDWYSDHIEQDADLQPLHADNRWAILTDSLKGRTARYESRFDRQLRDELKDILAKDQDIRQEYVAAQMRGLSQVMDSLMTCMQRTDSVNQCRIAGLLDRYGWLGTSQVGDVAPVQFYILQHAPLKMQLKYRKQLRRGCESGDIAPAQYAIFEDRVAVESGRKQKYGSQILYDQEDQPYVAPCIRASKVNEFRRKVGLAPMDRYLQRWGLQWNYE